MLDKAWVWTIFLMSAAHADVLVGTSMTFQPLSQSAYGREYDGDIATAPFVLPARYRQRVISSERELDLYVGPDMPDMNTVNETGPHAGRYLYRTHEVRPGVVGNDGNARLLGGSSGGALSVVDIETGVTRLLVTRPDWEALDGLVWTPWQTLLFAEEVVRAQRPDPDVPQAVSGLVYELKMTPGQLSSVGQASVRPLLGSLAHEGIEVDQRGHIYVIDETRQGSIYRFVPRHYGDLTDGQLFALKVDGGAKTGSAQWVALDMNQVQISARESARAKSATGYCRPEDIERIDNTLYVALTCEDVDDPANPQGPGAILAVSLGDRPGARFVVAAGKNAPPETAPRIDAAGHPVVGVTGFRHPDNLANGPSGTLWIAEDNQWSDIWVYDPHSADADGDGYRDGVYLFASLKDKPAEATGIYFGPDPHTLFVTVQHAGTGNDSTLAISKQK